MAEDRKRLAHSVDRGAARRARILRRQSAVITPSSPIDTSCDPAGKTGHMPACIVSMMLNAMLLLATLNITKLDAPIVIDGDISDSGWTRALRIDDFVEYYKGDNAPPPARTSAWLAYDSRYLYVAFRNDDPKPRAIRAPFVDRDQVLADQDYDTMMLDTQNDRRAAQVFRVNPR